MASSRPTGNVFLGYGLHEKGFCRQLGSGTTVSNQKNKSSLRPARKPFIRSKSTGHFVSPIGLHKISFIDVSKDTQGWKARRMVAAWANRPVGSLSCQSLGCPAVPLCAAPSLPPSGVSGLRIRQISNSCFDQAKNDVVMLLARNLSNQTFGHTAGASGRVGAAKWSRAKQTGKPRDRFAQGTIVLQTIENLNGIHQNCFEVFFKNTSK